MAKKDAASHNVQTHYEGCWKAHHECALALIHELQDTITEQARDIIDLCDERDTLNRELSKALADLGYGANGH